jgi:hypothetical protein
MKGQNAQKAVSKTKSKKRGGILDCSVPGPRRTKRKVSLGPVKATRKSEAEERLAKILEPINSMRDEPSPKMEFGKFVRQIYLPFYSRKWKRSTFETNEERVTRLLLSILLSNRLTRRCLSEQSGRCRNGAARLSSEISCNTRLHCAE